LRRRPRQRLKRLLAALGLGALAGCAVLADPPQTAALRLATPPGLSPRAELEQVPFFPQTPYHCGPAALATALGAAGLPSDPQALADAVFLPAREGSLQVEMLGAARRRGALATPLPGELAALLREVDAGHPVVVLQNLGLAFAPRWHYAVLVGYDLAAGELTLRSGTTRRERMSAATFEHTWARGGHWAIVVLPPGRVPAAASEADAVQAAIAFERSAAPGAAATAYRALLERWPANLLAAIGLANALDAGGDTAGAARVLEGAAAGHDSAVVWINLARLRLALGDRAGAREAAQSGVRRAEAEPGWAAAARETLALAGPP
jgi:hypothetical protein